MQEYAFNVDEQDSGERIDIYLVTHLNRLGLASSRTFIQRLIRDGNITVDEKSTKPRYKLKLSQTVKVVIPPQPEFKLEPQNISLDIVYEDDDILVINKSRNLVVHPAAGNLDGTLVNALLFYSKNLSTVDSGRPGIVHRLDKDTAGLLVVAKNNAVHLNLAKQFSAHSIKRVYVAIVEGRLEFDEGVVDLPIGRHPIEREKMSVTFKSKTTFGKSKATSGKSKIKKEETKTRNAYTRYRAMRRYRDFTFVELIPHTGRTHQLRVHMAAIGHPILGDATYGRKNKMIKLALFAKYLGLKHPVSGKFIEFEKPLPGDMQEILDGCNE